MSESNIKVAVHRLRRGYRELLREEVATTVDSPEEIMKKFGICLPRYSLKYS